jgi:hypothetical protein
MGKFDAAAPSHGDNVYMARRELMTDGNVAYDHVDRFHRNPPPNQLTLEQ